MSLIKTKNPNPDPIGIKFGFLRFGGAMGNAMSGMNQATPGAVPPPIPVTVYHVAVNGQATGPYDINILAGMIASGQITASTLVWKSGMAAWSRADTMDDLKGLFGVGMPPIPPSDH